MEIIVGGRSVYLNSLGSQMDQGFISLYSAHFGHQALCWEDFESLSIQFFTANPVPPGIHDAYFNNFTTIWSDFLSIGNYDKAEDIWRRALSPALSWESSNPGKFIHKGTPYYFWGMTVLLRGDLDKGYVLVHRAVEEDIRTTGKQVPDTPGFFLASLNYAEVGQAFRDWVLQQAQYLTPKVEKYSSQYGRNFTLEDFRKRFLGAPPSTDIVFLFTYTIARLMRFEAIPKHAIISKFGGQFEAHLLFDISLVIDAALRAKNPTKWKFIDQAEFLSQRASLPLTNKQLQDINSAYVANFDKTLEDTISGVLVLPDGTILSRIQSDIAVAYGVRNRGAHEVSFVPAILSHFNDILQILMNVIFLVADFLY